MSYVPEFGHYEAGDEPEKYRWVVDALCAAFGTSAIRVGIPFDFGFSQDVGVETPKGKCGLKLKDFDGYDINCLPREVVMASIEKMEEDLL